jgi:TDG/mug DNA glycosylase family protein
MSYEALKDILDYNLKIVFIGYNPGLKTSQTGHHYAGTSNRFWKLLFESGMTPYKFRPEEDRKLLELGYGSTNIVSRPTRSAAEITKKEFKEGAVILKDVLKKYRPQIAAYMGIGVYKIFSGKKDIKSGLQEESVVPGTIDYVCSSPSGLNRTPYSEQLECFRGLKKLIENL